MCYTKDTNNSITLIICLNASSAKMSELTVGDRRGMPRRRSYSFDSAELEIKRLSKTSNLEISAIQSIASRLLEDHVSPRSSFIQDENDNHIQVNLEDGLQKLKQYSEEIIATVLLENLTKKNYDSKLCSEQAVCITKKVEEQLRLKVLKDEQKVLAVVYIGEVRQQGMQISSQCMWDPQKDFMASASYSSSNIFAVCYAFVIQ